MRAMEGKDKTRDGKWHVCAVGWCGENEHAESTMGSDARAVYIVNHRGKGAGAVNFFFQAEEGIRDLVVTGVQTCALPI